MMHVFRALIPRSHRINQAALIEVQKAFERVKELQKSGEANDLTQALLLITKTEDAHPFCRDEARYHRGEVSALLLGKDGFMNENPSSSAKAKR